MPKTAIRDPKTKLFVDVLYFLFYGFLLMLVFSGIVVILIMILGMFNEKLISDLNLSIPLPFSFAGSGHISWPDGSSSKVSLSSAVGEFNVQAIARAQFFTYFSFRLVGILFGIVSVWLVVKVIKSIRNNTFELVTSFRWIQWVAILGMAAHIFEKIVVIWQADEFAGFIQYKGVEIQSSWDFIFQDIGMFFLWLFMLLMAELFKQGHQLQVMNKNSNAS